MIIAGAISVKAAILNHKREVYQVYIDKENHDKDFNFLRHLCLNNNITILDKTKLEINEFANTSTGGVCCVSSPRKYDKVSDGNIVYLNNIEDPFNLGYCLRTIYALGINNVILNKYDYQNKEVQILKSSAGAFDMLNIELIDDEINYLKTLKNNGYDILTLFRGNNAKSLYEYSFKDKSLIIIGGEKRGIKRNIINMCNTHLYIPYASEFKNALNVTSATAIVMSSFSRNKL